MTQAANVTRIKTLLRTDRSVVRGSVAEELSPSEALAVDLAYDDFCRRVEQGEDVNVAAFCESHRDCQSELMRCIELHQFLDDNPDALDALEPIPWPNVGDTFADKTILAELGRGGIGRVYLAQETKLPRKVVLKVSAFENGEAIRLSRLEHDNIVPIYCIDDDSATGLSAICMPFLGQRTLHDVLDLASEDDQRPTAWADVESTLLPSKPDEDAVTKPLSYASGVLALGRDIASALQHCHAQRIYHLDLKPSNILLTADGIPMLIDFGISTDEEHREVCGGTKPYMSPEQIRTFLYLVSPEIPALDGKSDVYSLAVILIQLLTGKHPFAEVAFDGTAQQLLLCQQQPVDCKTLLSDANLPVHAAPLLEACLSPDAAARPTAAQLSQTLEELLERPSKVRRRALLAGTAVGFLAVAVGSWAYDAAEMKYLLGVQHLTNQRWDEAIESFGAAIRKAPGNVKYLSARASAYCSRDARNDFVLAHKDYLDAYRSSQRPDMLACVAYCDARNGSFDSAVSNAAKALRGGFESAAVRNINGYARSQLKSITERNHAVTVFRKLTIAYPEFQPGWYNLGLMYFGRALNDPTWNVDEGVLAMEQAIEVGPKGPLLLYHLAALLDLQMRNTPELVADNSAQQTRIRGLLIDALDLGLNPKLIKTGPLFKSVLSPSFEAQFPARPVENPLPERPRLIHPLDSSDSPFVVAVITD